MKDKENKSFLNFDDFLSSFGRSASAPADRPPAEKLPPKKEEKKLPAATPSASSQPRFGRSPGLQELLKFVVACNASDLHLNSTEKPALRIYGELKFIDKNPISEDTLKDLIYPILLPEHINKLEEAGYVDFSHEELNVGRFRTNVYKHIRGLGVSFRYIPNKVPSIEELDLPESVRKITKYRKGLVLVTGATGSGKSTTLASIINEINMTEKKHIITIEDPIEFIHENHKSRITHREVGEHANNFAEAIISALRSDPDVLVIGEMRDLETMSQALRAAETGILVLATLHTNTAAKAIERIINIFPAEQQGQIRVILSEVLCAVLSQQLVKRTDKKGRAPVIEVLLSCPGLGNLIREGKSFYVNSMIQTGKELGMQSMESELYRLCKEGVIPLSEAKAHAFDMKYFEQLEGKTQ